MFAVIRTGGKQYRVSPKAVLKVEKLAAEPGSSVTFSEVLAVGEGESVVLGTPNVAGASVTATVLEQARLPKVIVFKKRRRKNSRRKHGHRQHVTVLRITGIGTRASASASAAEESTAPAETAAEPENAPLPEIEAATPELARAEGGVERSAELQPSAEAAGIATAEGSAERPPEPEAAEESEHGA